MTTLKEGVAAAISTAVCAGARGADWVAGLLATTPLPLGGLQEQTDKFRAFACNDNPVIDPQPVAEIPFSGGQCSNILYDFKIEYRKVAPSTGLDVIEQSPLRTYSGALIGVEPVNPKGDGFTSYKITHTNGNSSNTFFAASGAFDTYILNPRIINVVRRDGNTDSCGDPPVAPPPAIEEHEEDIDVEYDDPAGNPVILPDIPIKFFKPCINLDGIRIPFELDLGFAKLCGKVGLQPDLKTILEPAIDFDQCPSEKQNVGYSQEQIEDFFEFLPAIGDPINFPDERYRGDSTTNWNLEDKPIQGVFVRAIKNGDLSKTILLKPENNSSPNLILPRIGTVFFEYLIEKEDGYETGFSDAIPIKNVGQFIPCPWQFGAVKIHYIKEEGWDMSLFPVARKSCCDACSGNDPNKGLDNLDRCRID